MPGCQSSGIWSVLWGLGERKADVTSTFRSGGLTASRFAEHPVGGAARPAKASIAQKPTPGWPGSVEDPRPSGCFAKRSGGGSIELLG